MSFFPPNTMLSWLLLLYSEYLGSVLFLIFFLHFRIILAIFVPLNFLLIFRITLSISIKYASVILIDVVLNIMITLWENWHVYSVESSFMNMVCLHLIRSWYLSSLFFSLAHRMIHVVTTPTNYKLGYLYCKSEGLANQDVA